MKTTKVTPDDIARSVVAVPPVAWNDDLTLNRSENQKIVRHIESGGVSTLMYGGNANLYSMPVVRYAELLECISDIAGEDSWVIPSVGPDYGRLVDQCAVVRDMPFPTAMVLPLHFPATPQGVEAAIRKFIDGFGRPVILYIRSERYLRVEQIAALVEDGLVAAIKYAIVREDPGKDDYLERLLHSVNRSVVLSGLGEPPAILHMREFGLPGFTSGLVCIAPRRSSEIFHLLRAQRWDEASEICRHFLPLDDLRKKHNPISVLHDAVTLGGIADAGPILPMLSNLGERERETVSTAAAALLAADTESLPAPSTRPVSLSTAAV